MDSPEIFAFKKGIQSDQAKEYAKSLLPELYRRILLVLDTYMDIDLRNKHLVALWIIGTYFHKSYVSFPRLFINAQKGSGKSRLLQILKALCWNGTVQTNLTEGSYSGQLIKALCYLMNAKVFPTRKNPA